MLEIWKLTINWWLSFFNFELDLILPETRFPEIVIPLVLNCVLLIFLPKACIPIQVYNRKKNTDLNWSVSEPLKLIKGGSHCITMSL